jgi:hypothetical protein
MTREHEPELWERVSTAVYGLDPEVRLRIARTILAVWRNRASRVNERDEHALALALADLAEQDDDDLVLALAIEHLAAPIMTEGGFPSSQLLFLARWGEAGMPSVRVSGKQAAALMLSDLGEGELAELRPPWRAFSIVLDEPVRQDGQPFDRVSLLRRTSEVLPSRWMLFCHCHDGYVVTRDRSTPAQLYCDLLAEADDGPSNLRIVRLLGRLTLNTIVALEPPRVKQPPRPRAVRAVARASTRPRKRRPLRLPSSEPTSIRLAFPVSVDLRARVDGYAEGAGTRAVALEGVTRGRWESSAAEGEAVLTERVWIPPRSE